MRAVSFLAVGLQFESSLSRAIVEIKELGELQTHSEGIGTGSTFTVRLQRAQK